MLQDDLVENEMLNKASSIDKVEKVTAKLKNKKVTGADLMPNEVLKYRGITLSMYPLFNAYVSSGFMPSHWLFLFLRLCTKTQCLSL